MALIGMMLEDDRDDLVLDVKSDIFTIIVCCLSLDVSIVYVY